MAAGKHVKGSQKVTSPGLAKKIAKDLPKKTTSPTVGKSAEGTGLAQAGGRGSKGRGRTAKRR